MPASSSKARRARALGKIDSLDRKQLLYRALKMSFPEIARIQNDWFDGRFGGRVKAVHADSTKVARDKRWFKMMTNGVRYYKDSPRGRGRSHFLGWTGAILKATKIASDPSAYSQVEKNKITLRVPVSVVDNPAVDRFTQDTEDRRVTRTGQDNRRIVLHDRAKIAREIEKNLVKAILAKLK